MRRKLGIYSLSVCICLLLLAYPFTMVHAVKDYNLSWVPSGSAGSSYGFAVVAAALINKYSPLPGLPKIKISVVPGKGSVNQTKELVEGKIDIGLVGPDPVRDAYNAKGGWAKYGTKGKELRILIPCTTLLIHIMALWDDPVKTFWDLKGKRVAQMGRAMSGMTVIDAVYKAANLDQDKEMKSTYYTTQRAATDALRDGHADVVVQLFGFPHPGTQELATVKHLRFISIPDEVGKKTAAGHGSYNQLSLPANTYPKQDYSVPTIAVVYPIGATSRMPDDVAYEICKILHEHQKEGAKMYSVFGQFSPESVVLDYGAPLHPGAEKYWREIGWLK